MEHVAGPLLVAVIVALILGVLFSGPPHGGDWS